MANIRWLLMYGAMAFVYGKRLKVKHFVVIIKGKYFRMEWCLIQALPVRMY